MITPKKAQELIQKNCLSFESRPLSLEHSYSFFSKENLNTDREYPPFDRSMMDGICVNFDAYSNGLREFKIEGIQKAGEAQKTLLNLEGCFEVMTGAVVVKNCNLVIPYEAIEIKSGVAVIIEESDRTLGQFIHKKGSDLGADALILNKDSLLNGPHIGIAASVGFDQINVETKPKVLIISTGDELVEVAQTPEAHQIRRSNVYALRASLNLHHFKQVDIAHLKDDVESIDSHFKQATKDYDWLIYSGGVSKGKFDFLPSVFADNKIEKIFHRISQRPGKPFFFGVDRVNRTQVFGLPGNPVSSLVCLHRYILKSSRKRAQLSEEVIFKKDLTYFAPVKVLFDEQGTLKARPLQIKNSGEFSALAGSDGFVELPAEQEVFKKGQAFDFYSWGPL